MVTVIDGTAFDMREFNIMSFLTKLVAVMAIAVALIGSWSHRSYAALIFSVDMDPGMAGIQSTLSVTPSATFTVDVVISNDSLSPPSESFDLLVVDTFFNDMGPVLSLGPTGPEAGTLAAPPRMRFLTRVLSFPLATP